MRRGEWQTVGYTNYRVAEYRPPEFLVEVHSQDAKRLPGDTFSVNVQARYLFGAPMGRATFTWTARQSPVSFWDLRIPGIESWYVGDNASWWEEQESSNDGGVFAIQPLSRDAPLLSLATYLPVKTPNDHVSTGNPLLRGYHAHG